jgi:hypothetical protein
LTLPLHLFDYPKPIAQDAYTAARDAMVERLRRDPAIIAIYGLGNVAAPGISDLDLLAVVADDLAVGVRPWAQASHTERYLFTHAPFAISRRLLPEALQFIPCGELTLLWGKACVDLNCECETPQVDDLARQTACEYLLANYLVRTVEARYMVLSVRSLMLSSYALRHDLALLGGEAESLGAYVAELGEWRMHWFDRPKTVGDVRAWFAGFIDALKVFLEKRLAETAVAVPSNQPTKYARHIRLSPGSRLEVRHRGVVLPPAVVRYHRRFVRAQHRLNRFEFTLPAYTPTAGSALATRFGFYRTLMAERRRFYPQFAPFATPWVNLS